MALTVDLNCDVGESFGVYTLGRDAEILEFVTSANIACGFHAGDPATMRKTVHLALEKHVAIGAHPGFPDLIGFGRRVIETSPQEAQDLVTYQVGALLAFVRAEGATLRHVKPHGALYNMAARNAALARAIADAVQRVDPQLVLVGLSGSELVRAGEDAGLATASEVFADRTYQADGSLTPRQRPGATITDPLEAARRVVGMIERGSVLSEQGTEVPVRADTVCIHGDTPDAVAYARAIRQHFAAAGMEVRAMSRKAT
jgi:UPF0271 protein